MLRLRVQNYGETNTDNSYVTDMGIRGDPGKDYFFITAPQNTSNVGDQNTFVISSTSNVGIGTTDPAKPLHVVGDSWITGTLTASNIIGASPVTISSNLVMASGFTLTAGAIEPPAGSESNLKITGTITTSNITHDSELTVTTNLLMGSDKTLTTSNIVANAGDNLLISSNLEVGTSNLFVDTTTGNVGIGITTPTKPLHVVGDSWITGTLTASNIIGASPVTISSNLVMASGFTLTAGAIEPPSGSESNLKITGTITTSNIVGSSSLTVTANTNVVAEFTASEKLIKYPTVKMTAATTSGYTASVSSELSSVWAGWKAFNGVVGDEGWHDDDNTYSGTTGYYVGGRSLGGYSGEWIKLQLPDSIKLTQIRIAPRTNQTARAPKDAICLGSTDGSNWYSLTSWTGATYTDGSFTNFYVNTNNYYSYIAIVTTRIDGTTLNISEIEYYGYPENDLGDGTSVLFKTVPNTPKTDFLDVYYDAKDYSTMPATITNKNGGGSSGTPTNVTFNSTEPKSFEFNGTSSYINSTLTNPAGDWAHSINLWLKVNANSLSGRVDPFQIGNVATASNYSALDVYSDRLSWYFYSNDVTIYYQWQPYTWFHLGLVHYGGGKRDIYINGILHTSGNGTGAALSLAANAQCTLGRDQIRSEAYFPGSIANFRVYDRALSADEVWELYGYQKAYFSVSSDVVTYKAGRVGIGTSEPRAVLDVVGSLNLTNGITYNNIRSMFMAYSTDTTGNKSITWPVVLEKTGYNIGNHYDTTTGWYTAPITGVYSFNIIIFDQTYSSIQYSLKMKPNGQSVFSSDNWKPSRDNGVGNDGFLFNASDGQPLGGSLEIYCEEGDMVGWGVRYNSSTAYYAHCAFSGRLITPI
jgi:hypothetical protein